MNKTVLITGASSGFGLLTAKKFAENDWRVFALSRNNPTSPDNLELLQLSEIYEKLTIHQLDVTSDTNIASAISSILAEVENIDVLVNNAGFGYLGPVETFEIEEIRQQYDVNLFGYIRMIKAVVPRMREKQSGIIINISSVNGLIPFPLYGIYSSSKFAIETISEVLDFELSPFGIRSVLIEPGVFSTNFSKNVRFANGIDDSVYAGWARDFWKTAQGRSQGTLVKKYTNPSKVSDLIFKIANKKNPKLRYKVGLDTHLYTFLKKIVPYSVWRWGINRVYKWNPTPPNNP